MTPRDRGIAMLPHAIIVCLHPGQSHPSPVRGVTHSILRRVGEHKKGSAHAFTRRYNINRLVHVEVIPGTLAAIRREKELKRWSRVRKIRLIESANPEWLDLSEGWYESNRPG